MTKLNEILDYFVKQSATILGENLTGIYLHGSAVMGCFNEKTSDIDLLVVVNTKLCDDVKIQYMNMVVGLNESAPQKGIELSIVRKDVCNPFVYPTPFELHFSIAHLDWFKNNPNDYVERMNGTDKDLAAHFTIITHRGKCLYGSPISEVIGAVSSECYFDSIWNDIKDAKDDIYDDPTYVILNLCRVLAYKKGGLVLSKKEGGQWGIKNIPVEYHQLISQALEEYSSNIESEWDVKMQNEFTQYMIGQIIQ